MMEPDLNKKLGQAFGMFTAQVAKLASDLNARRAAMEKDFPPDGSHIIPTEPDGTIGNNPEIRAYENALEVLKHSIQNRDDGHYNAELAQVINGQKHAIRALEVEFVHPRVDAEGHSVEKDRKGNLIPEWTILAVRVRGLISIEAVNLEPNYSSKSSSSSVAHI